MKKPLFLIITITLLSHLNCDAANFCLSFYSKQNPNYDNELNQFKVLFDEIKRLDSKHKKARSLPYKYKKKLFDKYLEAIFKHGEYFEKMKKNESIYNESFLLDYAKILEMFSLELSPFNTEFAQLIDYSYNQIFELVLNKKNIKFRIEKFKNDFGIIRSEVKIFGGEENAFSRFVKKIENNLKLKTVFSLYKLNGFTSAVDPDNSIYYINLKSVLNFKGNETVAHEMYHAASALKRASGEILLEDGWIADYAESSGPYQNFALEELKAYDISARVTVTKFLSQNNPDDLKRLKDIKDISLQLANRSKKILRILAQKLKSGEAEVGINYHNSKLEISFEDYSIFLANISLEKSTKEDLRNLLLEKLSFAIGKIKIYNQLSKDIEKYEQTKDLAYLNHAVKNFRNKSVLVVSPDK